jgi:CHAT domain-containing protein
MTEKAKTYLDYSKQVFEVLNDYPYKYYALLGKYYETIGDKENAKKNYLYAVSLLNVSKWGIKLETNVDSFLGYGDKEDIYLKAISALLDDVSITANIERAFELFETFRSKLFMENTLLGRWNSVAGIPLPLLKEREGLIKKLNKLYSSKDYLDNINDINNIEKDLYYCDEKIASIKGGYKAFVKFDFKSLSGIQSHIPDSGLVLEYFYYDNKVYIFLISNKTFNCVYIDYPTEDLEELITGYLNIIKKAKPNELVNSFYGSKAFNVLVSPVLAHLDSIKELVIIPYNILHSFPIHSLFLSYKEELLISYLPNLQSISLFKSSSTVDHSPMIIGDPRNNLKGSLEEVNTIKNLFHSPFVLNGRDAKKEIIIKELAFHSIIHYSGHIRYNVKRPLYSYLECSEDNNNNGFIDRTDAILLKEIYQLNLKNIQFLSLSGCSSGLSTRYKGEELVGLVRGFFYAGISSILATMWDVEDQSTKDFMIAFFKNYIKSANKKKAFNYAYKLTKDKYKFSLFYGGFILYEGF